MAKIDYSELPDKATSSSFDYSGLPDKVPPKVPSINTTQDISGIDDATYERMGQKRKKPLWQSAAQFLTGEHLNYDPEPQPEVSFSPQGEMTKAIPESADQGMLNDPVTWGAFAVVAPAAPVLKAGNKIVRQAVNKAVGMGREFVGQATGGATDIAEMATKKVAKSVTKKSAKTPPPKASEGFDYSDLPDKADKLGIPTAKIDYSDLPDKSPVEMALLDAQRTPENVLADTVTRQRDIQAGNVPSQGEIVQPVANKSVKVETGVDSGVAKDIPVEEGIRSEQRNMILIDMEQSLKIGKNYGVESRNYGGGWENVNVGSSNPPWLNDLMAAFKKDTKKSVTKEEILATLKKMQDPNSKSLTDKQIDIRYHLDRTIKEMQEQGSFRNEAEAAHLEGRGFVRQQGEIEAYNIDPGDKFIIDGEEFTAKGIDENGNVTLKDGVTRKVSPDETVPFEAIKKTEGEGAIDEGFDFGEEPSKSPELPKREPTSTGIKNAVVEAERKAASLDPVKKQEVYGNEAAFEDAKVAVEKGEIDPRGLAREVAETPRPITTKEEFALLYDRQRIKGELRVVQKQIDEAQRTGDGIKELELTGKRDRLESDLDFNDKGSTQGGTELGRAMQARTRMIQEDYSLEEILRRARADNGGKPLTPEQRAKYEGLAKRIAEAEDALKKAEAAGKLKDERISQLEAERFVKKVQGEVARENRRVKRAATKEALKEEFDDLVGQLNRELSNLKINDERGSFSTRKKDGEYNNIPSMTTRKGTANITPETTPKAVGGQKTWEMSRKDFEEHDNLLAQNINDTLDKFPKEKGKYYAIRVIPEGKKFIVGDKLNNSGHYIDMDVSDRVKKNFTDDLGGTAVFYGRNLKEAYERARGYSMGSGDNILVVSSNEKPIVSRRMPEKGARVFRNATVEAIIPERPDSHRSSRNGKYNYDFQHWNAVYKAVKRGEKVPRDVALEYQGKKYLGRDWSDDYIRSLPNPSHPPVEGGRLSATLRNKLSEERGSISFLKLDKENPSIVGILAKMAENRVKAGIKTAEGIIDHIYSELKNIGYEISKRDIRDVISGYGKTSKMNQEAIEIELRELRRQMRLISAVEDAKAGKSPLRSGLQRDPVSDEVRKLTRQVKEEMRKSGIDVKKAISPEQQWKTGLDAAKTRLRHLYDDLKKQIETGEKTPQRKPLEYDREATELKKAVDHLRQVLVSIEGRPQLTYPQRVRMAEKAIERSINNLRANILTGAPTTFPKPTPNSPKLTALRKVKEELLKTKKQLADLAKAPKNPDEVAFKSWKTRTENRIAELEKKAAEGDFSSPARKEAAWRESKEALTYQHNLERAKEAYNQARLKDRLARRTILEKGRDAVIESLNLSRSVITSFDLSAVLRQGGFIVFAHPVRGIKTLPAMFRALSKKGQFAVEQQIKNRPNYKKYKDSGLFLSEHGDVNLRQMEEAYMSRLADKVPGVGASQRAYTTFLNKLRADSFDAMAASLSKNKAATPEEMKAIANYINVATGRGNLWMQENALVGLNTIFFAPRLVASRFNLLAGQPLWRGTARGRIQIAKEYARFLAGVGTVLSLAYMMGAEVETDPRSADFAKIKIGNTRLDPLAGLAQVITLIARVTTGETKTLSGDYMSLRGEDARYGTGVPNVVGRFLRTKFAPVPGAGMDLLAGEDVVGNEVTPATAAAKAIIPMSFRDIYEAIKDLGLPAGAALSILGLLGMGLNTFEAY